MDLPAHSGEAPYRDSSFFIWWGGDDDADPAASVRVCGRVDPQVSGRFIVRARRFRNRVQVGNPRLNRVNCELGSQDFLVVLGLFE